jgi:membrane-bound metal-dependent hydrolase YbcI (DUF457 family)
MIAKRVEPKVSLGTLMLAALLADFLWVIFLIAGIEHVDFKPGAGAANYVNASASDFGWSHSLLMVAVWAALLAGAYFLGRRFARGALVVFAASLSHWLLDFVSLASPLTPGSRRYYGLGLWYSVPATIIVEGGFWLLALIFYARATRPKNRLGTYAFWIVIALLTLAWYNNITGSPPPSARVAGVTSLIFFSLIVAWAYWMNRLRLEKEK